MSSEDDLRRLIKDWRDSHVSNGDWRQRYYTLRDEHNELQAVNASLVSKLSRPESETIALLRSELAALSCKCEVLMEALDAAKLRRKSSASLFYNFQIFNFQSWKPVSRL